MKRHLKLLIGVLVFAVVLSVPATASADITLTAREKAVVAAVNKIRASHGLAKLRVKPSLVRAARAHSKEMGVEQYFAHESADGESFGYPPRPLRLRARGLQLLEDRREHRVGLGRSLLVCRDRRRQLDAVAGTQSRHPHQVLSQHRHRGESVRRGLRQLLGQSLVLHPRPRASQPLTADTEHDLEGAGDGALFVGRGRRQPGSPSTACLFREPWLGKALCGRPR